MLKDIKGYEGLYAASDDGRIFNIKRNKFRKLTTKPNGYVYVDLSKDGIKKYFRVHRLIAETFIENPHGYSCVMHKDNNKSNNCVDNLMWGTVSSNTQQAYRDGLIDKKCNFEIYNDNDVVLCHGYDDIYDKINYTNKNTVCSCIKNNSTIRFGKYKGYKIRKVT